MHTSAERISTQTYQTIVYERALHPELFQLKDRRTLLGKGYELEVWLMGGGHLVRFERGRSCASELVIDREAGLPTANVVVAFPCAGEREFEHKFSEWSAGYMTSVQTESLSENLYRSTLREMTRHIAENDSIAHGWKSEAGENLSIVDVQVMSKEVHVQAYHLVAEGGFVLRTQSLFEHA